MSVSSSEKQGAPQPVDSGVELKCVTRRIAWILAHRSLDDWYSLARAELLETAARLMRELYRAAGFEEVAKHVEYVLATQPAEHRAPFIAALRRHVPGRGGEVMNYVEQWVERGRREGKLEGQVMTIEGFLRRDVPWSTIEAAAGIDEAAFRKLEQQLDDSERGVARAN